MKVEQKLKFKLTKVSNYEFIDIIKEFTQNANYYNYLEEKSEHYTRCNNDPSCMIFLDNGHYQVEFAITQLKEKYYFIAEVKFLQDGNMPTILEYNALLRRFVQDFKGFIHSDSIRIKISKEDIGLSDIILSPKARGYFEKYLLTSITLASFDTQHRYHPFDNKHLDFFICAAFRYCKKKIDIDLLKRYLIEELNWSKEDAKKCCDRIKMGLEILKVNKKFSR